MKNLNAVMVILIQVLLTWVVAIGYVNYGLCWRTVLATLFVLGLKWVIYETGLPSEDKKQKKSNDI